MAFNTIPARFPAFGREAAEAKARPSRSAQMRSLMGGRCENFWGWAPVTAFVLFFVAIGLQPVQEDVPMTATEEIIGWAIIGSVFAAYFAGTVMTFNNRRTGLWLAFPATLLMLFIVVSCPASGHHGWGSWVYGSFGAGFAALAIHGAAMAGATLRGDRR